MKTVSALEVRKKFGSVIDEVCETKQPVVIARGQKKLVVIVPYEDYEENASREARLRRVADAMDKWRNDHAAITKGISTEKIIREIRDGK